VLEPVSSFMHLHDTSKTLEHAGMATYPPSPDPLVQALQKLLEREGGHIVVGDEAGINDQSLYQIAFCRLASKTKAPKGVGPSIRRRLDARYPDWLSGFAEAAPCSRPPLKLADALQALDIAFSEVPPAAKTELLDALAMWVKHGTKHLRTVQDLLQTAPGKDLKVA
jgi:hypothetical protein